MTTIKKNKIKIDPLSNAKKFTRTFESKIFPHFSIFTNESIVKPSPCSFIRAYKGQLVKISSLFSGNKLNKDYIINISGERVPVKKNDYLNPSDNVLSAIESYGIEHSLAYQVYRMVYSFRGKMTGGLNDDSKEFDKVRVSQEIFNLDGYNQKYLNPLARLHYKYAVFLEPQEVKTVLFAKPEETPRKYHSTINIPSPHLISEIYITEGSDNVVIFNIPNLYEDGNDLELRVEIETEEEYSKTIDLFRKAQNVFLSIFRLNDDETVTLKFEGLGITNDFFLNRRAAIVESEGGESLEFYKLKLGEISISTEVREEYSPQKSKRLTSKRLILESRFITANDEEEWEKSISRAKQVMHGIKNNRSST